MNNKHQKLYDYAKLFREKYKINITTDDVYDLISRNSDEALQELEKDVYKFGKKMGLTVEEIGNIQLNETLEGINIREKNDQTMREFTKKAQEKTESQHIKDFDKIIEENVGENIEATEVSTAKTTNKKCNLKKIGAVLAALALAGTIILGSTKIITSALDTKKDFQVAENYIQYVLESTNNSISNYNELPESLQILIEDKVYTDAQERKENPQEALRIFLENNNVSEDKIPEKVSAKINHFEAPPYYVKNIQEMVQTGTIYEILKPQSKGVSK